MKGNYAEKIFRKFKKVDNFLKKDLEIFKNFLINKNFTKFSIKNIFITFSIKDFLQNFL